MPLYVFHAATLEGGALDGEMEARAPEIVVRHLQAQGYIPVRVEEAATGRSRAWFDMLMSRRVSQDDIAMATRELSTLLRAGLPLDRAMEIVASLSESVETQEIFSEIRQDVRGGASLHEAMKGQSGVFTRFYLNMIRAGESGGALDEVLQRLSEYMERSKDLKETVKSALIYPVILVLVAVISVIVLLMFVVPQFTQMFEESGRALPLPTQVVVSMGTFFQSYWYLLLLGVFACIALFMRLRSEPGSRYTLDGWLLELPLIGDLIAKLEVARFSRTLGTLLHNGVSLLAALNIVKDTLSNTFLAERLDEVSAQIREGKGMGQPLLEAEVFPKLAVHMVMVGEETGRLSEMLIQVADVFDGEVKTAVKRLLGLMEPALILSLALLIGGIIMSILVAILSVNELAQ